MLSFFIKIKPMPVKLIVMMIEPINIINSVEVPESSDVSEPSLRSTAHAKAQLPHN
jgi:hypothetical protein